MNDFRKYYLALTLVSATLGGCGGGGGGGDATATPPAAMPSVNAGDDQNVIEDDVVSLGAAASDNHFFGAVTGALCTHVFPLCQRNGFCDLSTAAQQPQTMMSHIAPVAAVLAD